MKKAALFTALLLTLCSFTACGDDSSSEKSDKSNSSSSTEETTAEKEDEAETTEAEGSTEEDTTEADDETTSQPAAAENTDFKRGSVDGDVYTSDFAGIKFTAPEDWTFAGDDYILSMMNISLDNVGDDLAVNKAILDQVAIYDAMCVDQSTGANVIIEFENLAKEVPNPDKYTVDDCIESLDKQLSAMSAIEYEKKSTETVTLADQEYTRVIYKADVNANGSSTTMEQVFYVRREGKFLVCIIASNGQSNEDMTTFEKNFEALD